MCAGEEIRLRHGISDETILFGVVGELIERKGYRVVFDALHQLKRRPDYPSLSFGYWFRKVTVNVEETRSSARTWLHGDVCRSYGSNSRLLSGDRCTDHGVAAFRRFTLCDS